MANDTLNIEDVRAAAAAIAPHVNLTPVTEWRGLEIDALLGSDTKVMLKLELFQRAGTFKARGALVNMLRLSDSERSRGVTAVSAGNHAIAVAFAANRLGIDAKVVMMSTANPARIAAARAYGAEVVLGGDGRSSFAQAEAISQEEGRLFIHPFEGEGAALGTGTLGLEFLEQVGALDALVIPIGGGGLAAGVSSVVKTLYPECKIYGVEPIGANAMQRSFAAGAPVTLDAVQTIADSLAPPMTLPYSFAMCRRHIDDIVAVTDDELATAVALLFREMKLAVEPAAAAATCAAIGPLRERLLGKRVGVIVCGSNIDWLSFQAVLGRAA
jgi:threonine dehydratase